MTDRDKPFTALQRSMWAPLCGLTATAVKHTGSVEQRLSRLENDLAVKDALNKYTYCYDGSDLDGVMSVFHDDCTVVNPRGTYVGARVIQDNYRYLISCRKFSFHHVSNNVVRWEDDARVAALTAYFNCVIVFRSGAIAGGSGTYAIKFVKEKDVWQMLELRITMNSREAKNPAATGEIAPAASADAPPPPPPPTSSESSRDWIGPEALSRGISMAEFDASRLDWQSQYKLLIGSVTPRPIALVTTLGKSGVNAAPFGFFNALGSDPAMVMFSVGPRGMAAKDTVENIRECPEYVVHIVSHDIKDKMNVCATDYPRGTNELAQAGFTELPSRVVRPPYIAEAPIAFECRLMQMLELGRKPYHLIIGEIVYFHYHDGLVNERFHVNVGKVDAIGRMAGSGGYVRTSDRFEMPRIRYKGADSKD